MLGQYREDIELIVKDYLKQNLRVEIDSGGWGSENSRTLKLFLNDEEIYTVWFDVKNKEEYY